MVDLRELIETAPTQAQTGLATIRGIVVHGDRRGRELGFPTANVFADLDGALGEGVFAGHVELADGVVYPAAVSIGRRETFYGRDGACLVEAHLLDFAGDLYDQFVRVTLTATLREQQRFESIDSLITQMRADVEAVRTTLGSAV